MIKGCTKRVVVLKDVQSEIFEEAYFIMRPKSEKAKGHAPQTDILTEANRIVLDKSPSENKIMVKCEKKHSGLLYGFFYFLFGAVAGMCAFAIIFM